MKILPEPNEVCVREIELSVLEMCPQGEVRLSIILNNLRRVFFLQKNYVLFYYENTLNFNKIVLP